MSMIWRNGLRIAVVLAMAGLGLQLVPSRAIAPSSAAAGDDLFARVRAPAELEQKLRGACYDCHSEQTRWPWYAKVQPAGWLVTNHVADGRRSLNLSRFGERSVSAQRKLLDWMADELEDGTMPYRAYSMFHPPARLAPADRAALASWLRAAAAARPTTAARTALPSQTD